MKNIGDILGAALVALPAATLAASYHYVDTSGDGADPRKRRARTDALGAATDISVHSGVTLDTGLLDDGDTVPLSGSDSVSADSSMDSYRYGRYPPAPWKP